MAPEVIGSSPRRLPLPVNALARNEALYPSRDATWTAVGPEVGAEVEHVVLEFRDLLADTGDRIARLPTYFWFTGHNDRLVDGDADPNAGDAGVITK